MPVISTPQTRLTPKDTRFSVADIGDEVGVVELVRGELGSESGRQDRIREEDVAVGVTLARCSRFHVLPVVHEDEELRVPVFRPKTPHNLDPGTPGFSGERSHVVVVCDEVSRRLISDVLDHAGDEFAGLTVMNEGEVASHDGNRAVDLEKTGNDGIDDGEGRVKEHGGLGKRREVVDGNGCSSLDKTL